MEELLDAISPAELIRFQQRKLRVLRALQTPSTCAICDSNLKHRCSDFRSETLTDVLVSLLDSSYPKRLAVYVACCKLYAYSSSARSLVEENNDVLLDEFIKEEILLYEYECSTSGQHPLTGPAFPFTSPTYCDSVGYGFKLEPSCGEEAAPPTAAQLPLDVEDNEEILPVSTTEIQHLETDEAQFGSYDLEHDDSIFQSMVKRSQTPYIVSGTDETQNMVRPLLKPLGIPSLLVPVYFFSSRSLLTVYFVVRHLGGYCNVSILRLPWISTRKKSVDYSALCLECNFKAC